MRFTSSPMSSRSRQLAGVRFVDIPPDLPEKLPRMDIAVFIGFAPAGPLHTPVAIEDPTRFSAIFGEDLNLAWDSAIGEPVAAYLGPAVRAFFRNGGRRCWVIRVGGIPGPDGRDSLASAPETNVFPLPGLARRTTTGLEPAFAYARSPGTWFDAIRCATALVTRPLDMLNWTPTEIEISGAQPDVRAGDLLRLNLGKDTVETYLLVKSVAAQLPSPPWSRPDRYTVRTQPLGSVQWLSPEELCASAPFTVTWLRRPTQLETTTADVVLEGSSPPAVPTVARIKVSPDFSPPPGALLQLTTDDTPIYFLVERVHAKPAFGSPPSELSEVIGRPFKFSAAVPPLAQVSTPRVERLAFELRIRRGGAESARLIDLGFTPEHPRYWNALPDDRTVFESPETRGSSAPLTAVTHADFVAEVSNSRFPLAGGGDGAEPYLPIGMNALLEPWMAAESSGRSALVREGLENFSSALFLDPRLQGSTTTTLLADADFLRFQVEDAPPLRGLHAALDIEEATLIAIPDATHRRWRAMQSDQPAAPLSSDPVPHPRWWHFLPCNPPASPPNHGGPERGQFLDCALREVTTPVLWKEDSEESRTYRLIWSTPDADAEFILEEATRPDFSDAVPLPRSRELQHTFLAREPGIYYHRVRAEAGGESSDWSNGVVVVVGIADRWELESLAEFSDDGLLEITAHCCGCVLLAPIKLPSSHYLVTGAKHQRLNTLAR